MAIQENFNHLLHKMEKIIYHILVDKKEDHVFF